MRSVGAGVVKLGDLSNVSQVVGDVDQIGVELSREVRQSELALTEIRLHS